jgi:hypothetical protein
MKKVVGLLVILFTAAFLPAVSANQNPSVVVIDTAIDTTAKHLSGKIIYEVCVMETPRCPNAKPFMEGPGSASLPVSQVYSGGFNHGTIMASVVVQSNPNVNVIFIRIVPMAASGRTGVYTDRAVDMALDWVIANKSKFNIVAVSASVGRNNFKTTTNYCPINSTLQQDIITLQSLGTAVVFAAGNKYDYNRVDYPACIPQAIAVGSVEKSERIALHSNGGPDLDFYVLGDYNTPVSRAVGTSAATAAFAGYWAKVYSGSYKSTYDYIKTVTKYVENAHIKSNLYVNIFG